MEVKHQWSAEIKIIFVALVFQRLAQLKQNAETIQM